MNFISGAARRYAPHVLRLGLFVWLACLLSPGQSLASDYPNRPVKLVVPVAAGGLTDILARMLGQRLGERLGQPVVVENRPGAGGIPAMDYTAKAAPDGYTLVMGYPGALAVNQALYKQLPYDPVRSFAPVSLVAAWPLVLVAHPSVPANSLQELLGLVKSQPRKLNYASGGNTTTGHLAMELMRSMTGADIVHVPYKGAAPAMNDLIAGIVHVAFDSLTLSMPQVKAGRIKVLAISTQQRSALAPQLPTVAESGVPGFDVSGWYGIVAPAGTPRPVVERLSRELIAIVNEPAIREQMAGRGIEAIGQDHAQFERFIASETEKWGKLVRERNIKVE
ncbi:MAG: Bug family tripartite tricarboxylate transporter substrate binding protein [Burkholderiaceae bacterium]